MTRRIALIHPYLSVRGGAEGVCFEMIATLLAHGDEVTLFTAETPHATRSALRVGLGARSDEVLVRTPVAKLSGLVRSPKPFSLLGYVALLRALRKVDLSQYSAVCSTYGECDLVSGARQVCYIHYPIFHADMLSVAHLGGRLEKNVGLRMAYTRAARLLAKFDHIPQEALLFTNSHWTKVEIERLLGPRPIDVLYPPVRQIGNGLSVGAKNAERFSCLVLGRFEPYKRQDIIVNALTDAARRCNQRVEVHFAGRGTQADIIKLKALHNDMVRVYVHQDASDSTLRRLVSHCHIGASAFRYEHFGMAAAELLATGLPVFVPSGGGQPEVANDPRFVYDDPKDLAQKIEKVIQGHWSLSGLQCAALKCAKPFAEGNFSGQILAAFSRFKG